MKIITTNKGYTILITLMIIGFLLVLTTGILNFVLRELKENKANGNYLKAFAGAEGAMELALLDIKQNGYGYYKKITNSKILRENPSDNKQILLSYDLNSKTKTYTGILKPFKQAVIPLFYINDSGENKINDLILKVLNSSFDKDNMAWNIISEKGDGIGGKNEITSNIQVKGKRYDGKFLRKNLYVFLNTYNYNYLIIVNLDPINNLEFTLSSTKEFTKPISKIISSAKILNYKQNLETVLDNTEFLNILKYSLYSE